MTSIPGEHTRVTNSAYSSDMVNLADAPVIDFDDRPAPAVLLSDVRGSDLRPFTLMRSAVQKKITENDLSLLGVTSAMPDAGKSTISIALAASLQKVLQRPVVLIDLDFKRASVAEYLGVEVGTGVSDYLANPQIDLQSVLIRIGNDDLFIAPTRTINADTATLLAGPRFRAMTQALRSNPQNPLCLFDLPPAFANDDAMIALQNLDGYFVVVDSGKTTKQHLLDLLKLLSPATCYGSILNRYQGMIGDSYGYGSAAYSRYYEE